MAVEAIGTLERVLTATALTMPVLREPELLWAWSSDVAATHRARRGVRAGAALKIREAVGKSGPDGRRRVAGGVDALTTSAR